ncbi:MAG: DUF885 domain-containing protein [Steroidobacteraceae bacterium]
MAPFNRHPAWHAVVCAAALTMAGCSPPTPPATRDPGNELNTLVEQYFDELLPLDPLYATYIGENRYNDRLANGIAPEHIARRRDLEQRFLAQAQSIPVDALSEQARLTYDIFVRERTTELKTLSFPGQLLPIDQLYALPSVFAQLGAGTSVQPFSTVQDYENFLGRMRDFSTWADQAIANMREGMKQQVVQPRIVMQAVQKQLDDLADDVPEQSLFYQPIVHLPDSFADADKERITTAYRRAIGETVLPAYRRLADFVRKEYLPASRDTVAWSALPEGETWYRFLTEVMTTTSLAPDEIHEIGLKEVARIHAEMEKVKTRVGFKGDLKAFFRHVAAEPGFYYEKPADLLAGYRELKTRIDALLPRLFSSIPAVDYEVREVEAFRAESAAGASYESPSPDGTRPGIFYINTFNLRAQPRFGMETLSLHEASPGHHFQQSMQLGLTSLPRFRRYGGDYVAYVEGWGLYAESLGPELGLFTDPYQYYGRLSDEMLRAMRLVVDTGLHSRHWTRDQAIRYMSDNSSMAESDVRSEVDRYIADPGQALGYKIGEIRIRALRTKAEAVLGDRFDVREFHNEILKDGALPIDVLEAKMDRWLAAASLERHGKDQQQ